MAGLILLLGLGAAAVALGALGARLRRALRELGDSRARLGQALGRLERSRLHLRQAQQLARVATFEVALEKPLGTVFADAFHPLLGLDAPAEPGWQREELAPFLHPEDRARVEEAYTRLTPEKPSLDIACRIVRHDGAIRHVEIASDLVLDAKGRAPRIVGTVLDVTDRRRAEALREYGAALVRSSADAIVSTDLDGTITSWNRGAEAILGWTAEEVVGRHGDAFWADPALARELVERARGGEDVLSHEIGARRRDGTVAVLSITLSPIRDADGRIVGVSSVAQDITERKRVEANRLQRQKLEALGTLAGGIAHDFNNLLWVILGNAQLAQRAVDPSSPAAGQLERIVGASRRASELVDRILSFARPSAASPCAVHLERVIAEAVALLRTTSPTAVRILTDFRAVDPWVEAEPAQLSQIVMNLGRNAIAALEDGGTLAFRLRDAEDGLPSESGVRVPAVVLEVSDTGTGIAPADVERIFDPFFTTREVGHGSGLGLAIVQGIVTSLGGEIDLFTAVGQGSSFRIRLPRCAAPAASEEGAPAATAAAPPGRGEEVLVVDDDRQVLALLESLLVEAGYSVRAFADPRAALAAFSEEPARTRVIVADHLMPGMNGSDLIARMRAIRPELRALLLTGYSDPLGETPSPDGVLRKPIESSELLLRVHELLEEQRAAGAPPREAARAAAHASLPAAPPAIRRPGLE